MWERSIELVNATGGDVNLVEFLSSAPPNSYCHVLRLPPNSRRLVSASKYSDRNRNSGRSSYVKLKFKGGEAEEIMMPQSFKNHSKMTFYVGGDGKLKIEKSKGRPSDDFHICRRRGGGFWGGGFLSEPQKNGRRVIRGLRQDINCPSWMSLWKWMSIVE